MVVTAMQMTLVMMMSAAAVLEAVTRNEVRFILGADVISST